jgi:ABC-2 type transport system permease protein
MTLALLAFLRRDWIIRSTYRLGLLSHLGMIFFTIAPFFFVGKLLDPSRAQALAPYGGAYFPFVLLGLAFSRYLTISLHSFAGAIREEQLQGTLEALLVSPTGLTVIVLGGALWEFLWTSLEVGLYLGLGALVFGLDLSHANVPASIVLLVLTVVSLSSLGLFSACGILLFKEADPVNALLSGIMKLVSGVYFPLVLLPGWLEPLARLFPLTYALEGIRQAMLLGRSLRELGGVCLALCVFAAALWPLAVVSLAWTLRRLKTTGALSFR